MTIKKNVRDTFKKSGFDIVETKGNSRHGEYMFAIWHDGVQYTIDYHGHLDKDDNPDIAHQTKHLNMMIKNSVYHQKIKFIYDYLTGLNIGDIWVMSGGGMQIQAFFGSTKGYIATLYLDMDNINPSKKNHTLTVDQKRYNKFLADKFELFLKQEVELSLYKDYDGEDEDEDYDMIYNQ